MKNKNEVNTPLHILHINRKKSIKIIEITGNFMLIFIYLFKTRRSNQKNFFLRQC